MPEIIARKVAIARGLNKYFTGKICSNGHVSMRYTTSGTCEDCIRKTTSLTRVVPAAIEGRVVTTVDDQRLELMKEKLAIDRINAESNARAIELRAQSLALKSQVDEGRTERKAAREKRRFLKENLVTVNILGFDEDYHVAVNMVWMAAMIRNPEINKEDVITNRKKDTLYVMRCFPEDKMMLCEQTHALYSRRCISLEQSRQQAIASAEAVHQAEIDAEWPEFKP